MAKEVHEWSQHMRGNHELTGEQVRLIGVDTPETKHPRKPVQYFGKEATAFTQRTVTGKRVRLEYDQQRHDKYGRPWPMSTSTMARS